MTAMAKAQGRKETSWLASPFSWAAVTVAAGLVAYAVVQPSTCASMKECAAKHDVVPTQFNAYAAYGLAMVLVGETANLISTFNGAREAMSLIPDLRSRCLPSLLLVLSFVVLICESSTFAASTHPWFASARPDLKAPVYTVTYIEWLIIVPMLLVMAGHCALGRPMKEMGRPIMVTNVYIIFAWMALMTTNQVLRWSLIGTTFTMYAWASLDMVLWVAEYLRVAPADLSSRGLRPVLALGLIALFAVYAVVYMSILLGIMGPQTERMTYLFLNVGSKLCFSIAFVVIRGNEYHSTLTGVLKKLSTSNVAIVSILRGSFDILLPCLGDAEGRCKLAHAASGDTQQLEHALQRKVAGQAFGDLLADDTERARFAAYVRNAQRQAEQPQAVSGNNTNQPDWAFNVGGGSLPPVAQVLNCRLAFGELDGQKQSTLGCAVHLSVVPNSTNLGPGRQMVAAVRFTEESVASRPEEATPAPEFQAFEPGSESETVGSTCNSEGIMFSSEENSGVRDERMVASLMDVAKLGMSALLRSARSASVDGENEEESGYGDGNSYVDFKKPEKSKGTVSGTKPFLAPSMVSEEESEDSASVIKMNTVYQAPEKIKVVEQPVSPRAQSAAGSSVSRAGPFQRLSTLLEPEEERFSRSTTDEQKPPVAMPDNQSCQEDKIGSPMGDKSKAAYSSISAAVTAAAQEMMTTNMGADPQAKNATVTVTMRIAPAQFALAVGTVALAASVSLFSSRRR